MILPDSIDHASPKHLADGRPSSSLPGVGFASLSRGALAERWAEKDESQRADFLYQAATLATAVFLVTTLLAV